jgi:hypothetical protein|tara:strand:+ start:2421 stop:3563 length:1143 start_codon:yes stop_codon:yes gene_type:complete
MSGGSATTRTEPWEEQKGYLTKGFAEAGRLMKQKAPDYYSGKTLAGFDPSQTAAQQSILGYATGKRPAALQSAAENVALGQMGGLTPFSEAQSKDLLAGEVPWSSTPGARTNLQDMMKGQVQTGAGTPYGDLAKVYGEQYAAQIAKNMPAVRQQMVEYQPGGGSRGDIAQAQIANAASKNLAQNLAGMYGGAYQQAQAGRLPAIQQQMSAAEQAQARRFPMAQMQLSQQQAGQAAYPTIMGAPLDMMKEVGDVGAQRRAMTQEAINQAQQKYAYEAQAPMSNLQQYMANISGDYGGTSTQTPSALSQIGQMAGIIGAISDIRAKENITPVGKYKGMNVYDFNYKWSPERHRGLMAQEVEQVKPEAVGDINGLKYIDYGKV